MIHSVVKRRNSNKNKKDNVKKRRQLKKNVTLDKEKTKSPYLRCILLSALI